MAGPIEAPRGGGKYSGPGPLFDNSVFRPDRHLQLPDYVISNLQLLPPQLGKELGNRLVDALSHPIVQQISSGVDKVLDASSVAFNKVSLEIGNALGGNRLQPLAVTVGDHRSQSLFDADVTQSVRAAFVAQTIVGTMQHPGMYAFQFEPRDLDAFRQTLAVALKKSPGTAIKEKWKSASRPEKILMLSAAGIVGTTVGTGAILVLADACGKLINTPPPPTTGPNIGSDVPKPPLVGVSCDTTAVLPPAPAIGGTSLATPEALYAAFSTHMQAQAKNLGVSVLVTDTLEYGPAGFTAVGVVTCSNNHELDGRQIFLRDNATGSDGSMVVLPPVTQYPEGTIPEIQNGKLVFVEPNVITPTGDAFAIGELSADGTVIEYPRVISINSKGVVVRADHALSATRLSGLVQNDIALISRDADSIFIDPNKGTWVKVVLPNGTIGWVSLYADNGDQLIGFNQTGTDVLMSAKPVTPTLAPPTPKPPEPTLVPPTLTADKQLDLDLTQNASKITFGSPERNTAVQEDLRAVLPWLKATFAKFAASDRPDPRINPTLDAIAAKYGTNSAYFDLRSAASRSIDPMNLVGSPRLAGIKPLDPSKATQATCYWNYDWNARKITIEVSTSMYFGSGRFSNETVQTGARRGCLAKELGAGMMFDALRKGNTEIGIEHVSALLESLYMDDYANSFHISDPFYFSFRDWVKEYAQNWENTIK